MDFHISLGAGLVVGGDGQKEDFQTWEDDKRDLW